MEAGTNLEGYKEAASAGHCRVAKILEFGAVINIPTATNSRYGTEKNIISDPFHFDKDPVPMNTDSDQR